MAADELTAGQALAELAGALPPVRSEERVAAADALLRILAADVTSPLDLPAFDNAAMDGYALRADDLHAAFLHEIGHSYAGHGFAGTVQTGTCVRIMTGAPLPAGADTVVMREDVTVDAATVRVERAPARGANIRRRAEHIARGDVILARGCRLGAAELALAAGIGVVELRVVRRLRVGVLSTGDELADPPQPLAAAGSYDANRPLLRLSLQRCGFVVHDLGICADAPKAFAGALAQARQLGLDVLLTTGGAAQGDADVVRQTGGFRFVPLAIRPGRGLAVADLEQAGSRTVVLGLPGNAVAAFVMYHLLVRPLLLHLAGGAAAVPLHVPVRLAGAAQLRGGRIDYRRGRFVRDAAGELRVQPLREQGSAMLRTVVDADALVALGPRGQYADGDWVEAVPLALLE